jgi:hypothetical protein
VKKATGILLLTTKDTSDQRSAGTKRKTTAKGAKDAKDGKRVFQPKPSCPQTIGLMALAG